MNFTDFDPDAACAPNENYFGFPFKPEDCPLLLVSVPWDVTVSYRKGTALGPAAIRQASVQLDFFDFEMPDIWKAGIGTHPFSVSEEISRLSEKLRPVAERVIAFQEGRTEDLPDNYAEQGFIADLEKVNAGGAYLNDWLKRISSMLLENGKFVGVVGGDHSSPLGLIQALGEKYTSFGILHLDAHDDLRKAYEKFDFSHASIMYNALRVPSVERLVQVGVRDVCQQEQDRVSASSGRIVQFPDVHIHRRLSEGEDWAAVCHEIIGRLPQNVYVSFDIDVFEPYLCPHTGTPVPGGLSFQQVRYLLSCLRASGKNLIGFDLCEVAPDTASPQNEWDGHVGARVLYLLSNTLLTSIHAKPLK